MADPLNALGLLLLVALVLLRRGFGSAVKTPLAAGDRRQPWLLAGIALAVIGMTAFVVVGLWRLAFGGYAPTALFLFVVVCVQLAAWMHRARARAKGAG